MSSSKDKYYHISTDLNPDCFGTSFLYFTLLNCDKLIPCQPQYIHDIIYIGFTCKLK